jgi:N-formylmaleamate deformylase
VKESLDIPILSHMVELTTGRCHYLTWGVDRKDLPIALLLHGITSSALSWVRVAPALADRYRVYALDLRGHGDSAKPPRGNYSLRQTADDVLALIEARNLQNSLLIGHSWGGAVALVLASGAESEKPVPAFSRIILEDPAVNFGRGDPEKRAADFVKDIGRPYDELCAELCANSPGWTEDDIEGKIDALSKVSREAVISVFDDAGRMGNLLPLLARLPAPTLLMRADADLGTTMNDAVWEEAKGYLPAHSRAVQIDGANHNIHRHKFEAFMQAVNDFLRS